MKKPLIAVVIGLLTSVSIGKLNAEDGIPYDKVRQAGLHIQWMGHFQNDASFGPIVDVDLHVHDNPEMGKTFYEIRYDNQRETVAYTDIDLRGQMYGKEGAQQWVELRKEILEAEGKEVTIDLLTVPETTLYSFSASGVIHAVDAETGRTRWTNNVGRLGQESIGLGANNDFVIAVKGSTVYCLDSKTGQHRWKRPIRSAPGGGIALSDSFAYVTTISGIVQTYPLNETGIPSQAFLSFGRAMYDPVITSRSVAWPTEKGYFNVADNHEVTSVRYRLKTYPAIYASGVSVGDHLVINDADGEVFAVEEDSGVVAWEYVSGAQISKKPINLGGNNVGIITVANTLIAMDVGTGKVVEGWPQQIYGISDYVGASKDLLYFVDDRINLVALRRDTGSRVLSTPIGPQTLFLGNEKTDRLYFGTQFGSIACLREISSLNPYFHGDEIFAEREGQVNPFDTEAGPDEPPQAANPFGQEVPKQDAANPFGAGAKKTDADKKDNPFGNDKKKDDKKGGGNPFGK